MELLSEQTRLLDAIGVLGRRFYLRLIDDGRTRESDISPGTSIGISILRGAWGNALYHADQAVYHRVFDGDPLPPLYVVRPADCWHDHRPVIEFLLFDVAINDYAVVRNAWEIACAAGIGPDRLEGGGRIGDDGWREVDRQPFTIDRCEAVSPTGVRACPGRDSPDDRWSLLSAVKQAARSGLDEVPLRLRFATPFRPLRNKRLIESPTLADVVAAAHARVAALMPESAHPAWTVLKPQLLKTVQDTACGAWQGERLEVARYSARQRKTVRVRCVSGHLDLPVGAGQLTPLLAAATWLHLGKATTWGLGRLVVEPLTDGEVSRHTADGVTDTVVYSIGGEGDLRPTDPLPPLPPIRTGALVVVEGRAPHWRYAMAIHRLAATEASVVAVYAPNLHGAVVAVTRSADYWDGQVLPIDLEKPAR